MGDLSAQAGEFILGPLEVVARPEDIAAFAEACGTPPGEPPATFPLVWLAAPALRSILGVAAGPSYLPVHESQSFDYERPLKPGGRYVLSGLARRETGPDRLVVALQATDGEAHVALTMKTVLRLLAVAGDGSR